jgi:hypothetical protein
MHIAPYIAQHGFRRWYERELIRGHSHLLMLLLCAIGVMGAIEAFGQLHGPSRLLMVLGVLVAAAVGAWAMRRYMYHLGRAEGLANQADCPHCGTYARWQLAEDANEQGSGLTMKVCCRHCQGRWTILW